MNDSGNLPVTGSPGKAEKAPTKSQAECLLGLVDRTNAICFANDQKEPYAAIPVNGHVEVLALDSRDFTIWLYGIYFKDTGKPVAAEAIKQVIATLSAGILYGDMEPIPLHTRLTADGQEIWYDLSNTVWQAVCIKPGSWRVSDDPPLMFTRYRHQAAQCLPSKRGDIRKILRYVNVPHGEVLFLCWLVACYVPGIPHPMPIFYGEKGAAKSTTCGLLKQLIDPSAMETLALPGDPRALVVNLQQHWFLPFDNVSHINEETSDMLCRAITGGGIHQRRLFTNNEDVIYNFSRCLALNGINNVATRSDLLDRSLLIELERIADAERRELAQIKAEFEADRADILGGIFDTLAQAMMILPEVRLERLPRMADFARWGYAIGEALGAKGQTFLDEYAANRHLQNVEAISADPVATLVLTLMADRDEWCGLMKHLLRDLREAAPQAGISTLSRSFPSHPHLLSRRLRGIKSNLESAGIRYEHKGHSRSGAWVTLQKAP